MRWLSLARLRGSSSGWRNLTHVLAIPGDPPTFDAMRKGRCKTPEHPRPFLAGPHEKGPPVALTPGQGEDFLACFEGVSGR